jgi:hypothetical protein
MKLGKNANEKTQGYPGFLQTMAFAQATSWIALNKRNFFIQFLNGDSFPPFGF